MFTTPFTDHSVDYRGQTALHFAAQNGETEIAGSPIENGANVNAAGICFGHIWNSSV
jgi:ankyrin repeat protein